MKLDHLSDVSAFMHSAVSFGTLEMPPQGLGSSHRSNITAQRYKKFGCLIGVGLIHISESLCTATTCSPPRMARGAPEAVLAAFGRRYMQDPGCELRRISLPETVRKGVRVALRLQ